MKDVNSCGVVIEGIVLKNLFLRMEKGNSISLSAYWFQIIRASLEHGNNLANILQAQSGTNPVQRHPADIGTHIQNAGVFRFEFFSLFAYCFRFFPSQIKSIIL